MDKFAGRLGLQQRVLPTYRAPFFEALSAAATKGLGVYAGQPRPSEAIKTTTDLKQANFHPAHNQHLFSSVFYLCRQPGFVNWLEIWQPDALIVEANPRYPSTLKAIEWMHAKGRPVLGWGLGAPPLSGLLAGVRKRSRINLLKNLDGVI
ncbi:MAG: hypothetical protein N2D54_12820, partial [Chloroflexota bacterium]